MLRGAVIIALAPEVRMRGLIFTLAPLLQVGCDRNPAGSNTEVLPDIAVRQLDAGGRGCER